MRESIIFGEGRSSCQFFEASDQQRVKKTTVSVNNQVVLEGLLKTQING